MIKEEAAPKRISKQSDSQQKKLTALRKDIRFQKSKAKATAANQSSAIFLNQTSSFATANPKKIT